MPKRNKTCQPLRFGAVNLNGGSILGAHHYMECFEDIENLFFMFHQVKSCYMDIIIHKNNKPMNVIHIHNR